MGTYVMFKVWNERHNPGEYRKRKLFSTMESNHEDFPSAKGKPMLVSWNKDRDPLLER